MKKYKTLMELNRKEIFHEEISDQEKAEALFVFLSERSAEEAVRKYKKRMRVNPDTDRMYPDYYIPPYNGDKKLRLIQGYLPKTNILYANHYELEIIRLLFTYIPEKGPCTPEKGHCASEQEHYAPEQEHCISERKHYAPEKEHCAPEQEQIHDMTERTLLRLQNTCFGNSCMQGECAAAGISVLRFLSVVQPEDSEWIDKLLLPLGDIFLSFGTGQAAVQKGIPLSYLLMAFTDINSEKTREFIAQKKEWLLELLRRGWITGKLSNGKVSEGDSYNLMGKYIIRNALGTLPEYENISEHAIYVSSKDGRCYCSI